MGAYELTGEPTKPDSLSSYEYWYLQYCLITGLYMLEPWERKLFNVVAITTLAFVFFIVLAMSSTPETDPSKVTVLFKAVGGAPILKNKSWKVDDSRTIAWIITFLKKELSLGPTDSLFIFVNQAFSPSPDHTIGDLYKSYSSAAPKLTLYYSTTNAWG
ncbi:Ubiquitin-like protein ATG12 [Aphelenchoides besseyi]|nr:Ubiquitin-like protein ATG12 [Aphelenchoides besseyi]KAI6207530.1 Ubiquitin-like protein ATG12 [Aphelenchoides besseyi]